MVSSILRSMYIYAFLETPESPVCLPPGIAGELKLVSCDRLSVVVEPDLKPEAIQTADDDVQLQAILAHDRVLRELFIHRELLPVPFGTFLLSQDVLIDYLQAHSTEFLAKLDHVRNKAEYTLKLIPKELNVESDSAPLKGKAYFLAKKRRYEAQVQQQTEQQQQLEQLVSLVAQQYPTVQGETKDGIGRIFLLGDRRQEAALLNHVQDWRDRCSLWEINISEALPTYHFV